MTSRVIGIYSHIDDDIIGYNGQLMFTHRDDFSNFKEVTMGKTLLVGYRTAREIFERNPNGLVGRKIAILVSPDRPNLPDHDWLDQVDVVTDPFEYIETSTDPIVIAGGGWVFKRLWSQVSQWHVTHYPIAMEDVYYTYNEDLLTRFQIPFLPDPVATKEFDITLPCGETRTATIRTYLI